MSYKVLDLFSGCGGFSNGFIKQNFTIKGAIEFDKEIALTYQKNHPDTKIFIGDIRKLNIEEVKNELGDIDVIIGGPPCQGFSIAGKRDINDQRNTLPLEFIKYVEYFNPKIFVMENVKGLVSMDKGRVLKHFLEQFEAIGYKVKYKVLNCSDYEVPQIRERIFIVGVRNDIPLDFSFPEKSERIITLGEAIGDIEQIGSFEETQQYNHDMYFPVDKKTYELLGEGNFLCDLRHGENHVHSWEISLKGECSPKEISILNAISENRRKKKYGNKDGNPLSIEDIKELTNYDDISSEIKNLIRMEYLEEIDGKYDIHDRKINIGLRIFDRNKPVNTITTLSGANSSYAHYSQPRNFTVREVARLQTFDDNFIFYGNISSQYRQVGNAVPPKMAEKIAEQVKKILDNISL